MKIATTVRMNGEKWRAAGKLQTQLAETALRQRGVIFANALRTVTPPHGKGATMQSTAKKDNDGIRALKKRIAQDIAGVDSAEAVQAYAVPVLTKQGKWIAVDPSTKKQALSKGNFGFIVVQSMLYKTELAPIEDPAAIYGKPVFRRGRAHARNWRPVMVMAPQVRKLIEKRQKRAGAFISGWYHAFNAFGGKRGPAGFYRKLGGKGYGVKRGSGQKLSGIMGNEAAPEPAMAQAVAAREKRAVRIAAPALKTNARALAQWYKKKMREILA